jgi:hypothetical protein
MGDLVTNADGAGTGNSIENEERRDFISTIYLSYFEFLEFTEVSKIKTLKTDIT